MKTIQKECKPLPVQQQDIKFNSICTKKCKLDASHMYCISCTRTLEEIYEAGLSRTVGKST